MTAPVLKLSMRRLRSATSACDCRADALLAIVDADTVNAAPTPIPAAPRPTPAHPRASRKREEDVEAASANAASGGADPRPLGSGGTYPATTARSNGSANSLLNA